VEGVRSFSAGFWFPIGSRHEAPRERGFAHFVEHLLFKGTTTRSAMDIARAIDRVGGWLNAFTERDVLCVHCTVPSSYWSLALDLLVDLCFRSTLPKEEVEREREVIVSEILASQDEPEEVAHDLFLRRIWPDDSISRPIAGLPGDIEAAERDALHAFYRERIRPENLLVTLAGPVPLELLRARLEMELEGLELDSRPLAGIPVVVEPRFVGGTHVERAKLSQAYLFTAVPIHPPYLGTDWYVLSVLNGAFGESMSSRLFQGLRERDGLCYSVMSGFSIGPVEGLWMAQASSSPKSFAALAAALDKEIELIATTRPLGDEELGESLSRLEGGFDLALDDPEYRMKRLARQALHGDAVLDVEETRARIRGVGRAEIDAMTARVFASTERATFAYGTIGERGMRNLASVSGPTRVSGAARGGKGGDA
jgi:predicted Zn-dependent peptidase